MQAGFYHLNVSTFSRTGNQSGAAKHSYICRTGNYVKRQDDLVCTGSGNMPHWAAHDPAMFWSLADEFERANGRLGKEIEFALPRQLSTDQQLELVEAFAQHVCGKSQPFSFAIHRNTDPDKADNPHCHLIFSERINDYVDRPAKNFFKRYNKKSPGKGGAKKSTKFKPKAWLQKVRQDWSEMANLALKRADLDVRIDHRSYAARGIMRAPQQHLGPSATAELRRTGTHPRFEHNCKIEQLNNEYGLVETFVFNEQEDCSSDFEEVEAMQQQLIDAERQHDELIDEAIAEELELLNAQVEQNHKALKRAFNEESKAHQDEKASAVQSSIDKVEAFNARREAELKLAESEVQAAEQQLVSVKNEQERLCFDTLFAEAEARLFADLDQQFNDVKDELDLAVRDAKQAIEQSAIDEELLSAALADQQNEQQRLHERMLKLRAFEHGTEFCKLYRLHIGEPAPDFDQQLEQELAVCVQFIDSEDDKDDAMRTVKRFFDDASPALLAAKKGRVSAARALYQDGRIDDPHSFERPDKGWLVNGSAAAMSLLEERYRQHLAELVEAERQRLHEERMKCPQARFAVEIHRINKRKGLDL